MALLRLLRKVLLRKKLMRLNEDGKTVAAMDVLAPGIGEIIGGSQREERLITGLGLKEAKEVVDGAPKVVKEGASKEEAEEIQKKLEAEGAKVTLK